MQPQLQTLIKGCLDGDGQSQRTLYEHYAPQCYAICRRYTANDMDAEDALVEGFVHLFERIGQYSGNGTFEGWVQRIFQREAMLVNKRARRRETLHQEYADIQSLPGTASHTAPDAHLDLQTVLQTALRSLSPRENAIFNMVAIDGMSLREAGETLQINEGAAKSLYHRTRHKLTTILTKQGVFFDAVGKNRLQKE